MITLFTFGPAFELPDLSPFVIKAHLLLKLADLPYEANRKGFAKSPKGKLPYLTDDGEIIADSTFIRLHIERKYSFDFNRNLSAERKAALWALEKMIENHLYWAAVYERWMKDENFDKVGARMFKSVPAPLRPVVKALVRRKIRRDLHSQGMGRHSAREIALLAKCDIDATAAILGDSLWLGGNEPCGGDAALGAFVITGSCPHFNTEIGRLIAQHPNLVAYGERVLARYFPEIAKGA